MGKIYVITEGEYDDYTILGVTTDRAVAERMVELYSDDHGWYSPKIEEHDDTQMAEIADKKPAWNVTLWFNGGIDAERRCSPYEPECYTREEIKWFDRTEYIVPGNTREEAIEEAKKRRDEHDSNN